MSQVLVMELPQLQAELDEKQEFLAERVRSKHRQVFVSDKSGKGAQSGPVNTPWGPQSSGSSRPRPSSGQLGH